MHAVWLGGGLDVGVPFTQYQSGRQLLNTRFPAYQVNGRLSLHYIFLDRIGVELGAVQYFQHLGMTDKDFVSRHSDFKLKIKNNFFYPGLQMGLFYRQPIQPGIYVFGLVGYCWNFVGSKQLTESKNFIKGNEDIRLQNTFASQNNAYLGEIGIQNELLDRHMMTYALQFHSGQSTLVQGAYSVVQNGTVLAQDAFSSQGTYAAFAIRYHYLLAKMDRPEKRFTPPTVTQPVQPAKPTGKLVQPEELPSKLEGRKMVVTHRLNVSRPNVTIKVWDHEEIDGDIVSLHLNSYWLIQNYSLVRTPKVLPAVLHMGSNQLVSHAINLGKYKPNTAAISVFDGITEQKVILESDMNTSSVIEIVYNP